MTPKFSVCIPTYNMDKYIGESIKSVLLQTFSDFELIIQDNCSTDGTEKIVKSFKDSRIRYQKNDKNYGMYENINRACKASSGKYIKLHCADDLMSPNCLSRIAKSINQYEYLAKIWLVGITYDPNHMGVVDDCYKPDSIISKGDFAGFFNQNIGGGLANICIEREYLSRMGYYGYPSSKDYSRDVTTFFKLLSESEAVTIHELLVYERSHEMQNRHLLKRANQIAEYLDFYQKATLTNIISGRSNKKAWVKFLDETIANNIYSSLKPILHQLDFNYLLSIIKILIDRKYYRISLPLILKRFIKQIK